MLEQMHEIAVYKFGGASIKEPSAVRNMLHILRQYAPEHTVIVVSAMGKTTNALERLLHAVYKRQQANKEAVFQEVVNYHMQIANALFSPNAKVFEALQQLFEALRAAVDDLSSVTDYNQAYDSIVAYGELLSSTLLAHYFETQSLLVQWQDVRQCMLTNHKHREAKVLLEESYARMRTVFKSKCLYITQGFIAATAQGETTTLGREGSDYSAALIAAALNAQDLRIWKDVDGVYSADPRLFTKATVIPYLSYKEAVEMAYFGASIIHPKTMMPLIERRIPLRVCSFVNLQAPGSIIYHNKGEMPLCIVLKRSLYLLSLKPLDYGIIDEQQQREVFDLLYSLGCVLLLSQQVALSLSVCIDIGVANDIDTIVQSLQSHFAVRYNSRQMLISLRHYTKPHLDKLSPFASSIKMEQKDRQNYHFVIEDSADNASIIDCLNDMLG